MTGFLLPLDGADVEVLVDALNALPDDHYDQPLVQSLVARLRAGRGLYWSEPEQVIRFLGVGRAQNRPQG